MTPAECRAAVDWGPCLATRCQQRRLGPLPGGFTSGYCRPHAVEDAEARLARAEAHLAAILAASPPRPEITGQLSMGVG